VQRSSGRAAAASRNTQVVAWAVMLGAFLLFVALLVGVPWLAIRYTRSATVEQSADVECKSGSCALARQSSAPRVLRPGEDVPPVSEGFTLSVDEGAGALVRFFDGSALNLVRDASVELTRMRRPRFGSSDHAPEVEVQALAPSSGTTSILTAGAAWGDVQYDIVTPHGTISMAPESHAWIELSEEKLRVKGLEGTVTVHNPNGSVALGSDQVTLVEGGGAPAAASGGLVNIVANSDFDEPLGTSGWLSRIDVPGGQDDPAQTYIETLADGRSVARISRTDSGGRPADVVYEQALDDFDVSGATALIVKARLRVLEQSLPLGGMRGTEMPARINLIYEDADGEQIAWMVGFFSQFPDDPTEPEDKYVLSGEITNVEAPWGEWVEFDSKNLLDATNDAGFARRGLPPPVSLERLEIVASGHDYASDIDSVEVQVK
jgi:hypothetical protein